MKITNISIQAKNKDRVNVSVDGTYRFSLDIFQVGDLGIKVGKEYSEEELVELETESQYGKLYGRALEYTMMRPHSAKEIRDYLWRKTRPTLGKDGEKRPGVSSMVADRVYDRLVAKGYIDDNKFARYWVENRNQTKGSSQRKLVNELRVKGVDMSVIDEAVQSSDRNDQDEIKKIIIKKQNKYSDETKLMQYLARQGFSYDDIKTALNEVHETDDSA